MHSGWGFSIHSVCDPLFTRLERRHGEVVDLNSARHAKAPRQPTKDGSAGNARHNYQSGKNQGGFRSASRCSLAAWLPGSLGTDHDRSKTMSSLVSFSYSVHLLIFNIYQSVVDSRQSNSSGSHCCLPNVARYVAQRRCKIKQCSYVRATCWPCWQVHESPDCKLQRCGNEAPYIQVLVGEDLTVLPFGAGHKESSLLRASNERSSLPTSF